MLKYARAILIVIFWPLAPIVIMGIGASPLFALQQIATHGGAAMILPMLAAGAIGRLYCKVSERRGSIALVGLILTVMVFQRGFYPAFFDHGDGVEGLFTYNQLAGGMLLAVSFLAYRLMQMAEVLTSKS